MKKTRIPDGSIANSNVQNSQTLPALSKLNLRLDESDLSFKKAPTVLIAGCGTGQHALVTAGRFQDSKVTAIDLSLASLAYAKRKTKQYNVKNIEFFQADILTLEGLKVQYDIIESVGVLHHMEDPILGLKILTQRLKQRGLIRLGLYSEMARQNVVAARRLVHQKGIRAKKNEMLGFRQEIIREEDPLLATLVRSRDFYALAVSGI